MKAVLISPDPSAIGGGVERFCALLERVLASAGWSTAIVGPQARVPTALGRAGLGPAIQAASATRQARSLGADLVISNGFLGGPAGRRRIHVFHGTMVEHVAAGEPGRRRYRLRQALGGGAVEALCGRGASVVAVSRSAAAELHRHYRQPVDAVIPNGIDTELFSPGDRDAARERLGLRSDRRYALFVGRFEYRKGADLLSEACRRAGFELVVAGSGAPPSAIALGMLTSERLRCAYRAADCVAFPSRYEACSFVVLEALACKVPLLTTDVGWMSDFLLQCPDYARFIVAPEVDGVTTALCNLGAPGEHDAILTRARDQVVAGNGLKAFGRRWLELVSETVR